MPENDDVPAPEILQYRIVSDCGADFTGDTILEAINRFLKHRRNNEGDRAVMIQREVEQWVQTKVWERVE